MSSIAFVVSRYPFVGSMKGKGLRGVANTTIALAEGLSARGHHVECINPKINREEYNGVIWDNKPTLQTYDLSIANLYPDALDLVKAKRSCLWLRNPMNKWSRFRKCIFGILRHRPSAVFLSHHQFNTTPKVIPYKSRHVIEHGIDEMFVDYKKERDIPEKPIAIFSAAAHRNLDVIISLWKKHIHPNVKDAELHIYGATSYGNLKDLQSDAETKKNNIKIMGKVPHNQLAEALSKARLYIYPGHKEETFCNAAHEATACGLPIVTLGIGVLSERVTHNQNGIIAKNEEEMGKAIIDILSNDEKWQKLHKGAVETKGFYNWANRAEVWEQTFL